jgi:hypothetical protein
MNHCKSIRGGYFCNSFIGGSYMERTKAIVKFFSQEPIENVMVMMKYMPERVIFLGHKDNMITKQIRDIEQFRDHKYPDVEFHLHQSAAVMPTPLHSSAPPIQLPV